MGTVHESKFIISRQDRAYDPKTVIGEGLRIGRLPESDLWLNHPTVSRLHAGINKLDGYYYLINLSASSAITINGRAIPFNEAEALADGDVIRVGPFSISVERTDEVCQLTVSVQFALNVGEQEARHRVERETGPLVMKKRATGSLTDVAGSLKVFWGKRTREKAGRPSPLHPRTPPKVGKIRFNWTPTRDLVRPWPFAIFIWALLLVGTLSTLAAVKYRNAFVPQPISTRHTANLSALTPAIANRSAAGACTSCHAIDLSITNADKINANCAACHQTEGFAPTTIAAHRAAGITCITCHAEHRGENFRPMNGALESCAKCHNDNNKLLYNGNSVHTPHKGTYGYPVENGVWIWKGLDSEELEAKPEIVALLKKNRITPSQTQEWRNAQFHALHVQRVGVVAGIKGIADGETAKQVMSCSSCHKTGYMSVNVDRNNPRTTCGSCHNTKIFENASGERAGETPSCTSCHVQHVKDPHWAASLRVKPAESPAQQSTK